MPRWHREDGGRYINTYQATVTMDPDTGQHNLGIYRGMLGQRDTIPVLLWRAQNWGVHFQKWADRGMKMPVAHVYGFEPCLPFCASAPIPTGVSEYEVMGAMRGRPMELVKCETSDLMVPADCEMVIEGFIDPDPATFEMEGPFGEYTGYFGGDQGPKHVTKVTCVTYRDGSIHRGTLEGTLPKMLNENSITSSVQRAGVAWNVLERAGVPGITDVHCPPANNGTTLMIQMRQTYRGQAKQAAAAIWGSNSAHLRYKNVWVVDEDIDIHDYGALDWAFAYRVNAAEDDIVFFPATFGSPARPVDPAASARPAQVRNRQVDARSDRRHGQSRLRRGGAVRRRPLSALGPSQRGGHGAGDVPLEGIRVRGLTRFGAAASAARPEEAAQKARGGGLADAAVYFGAAGRAVEYAGTVFDAAALRSAAP